VRFTGERLGPHPFPFERAAHLPDEGEEFQLRRRGGSGRPTRARTAAPNPDARNRRRARVSRPTAGAHRPVDLAPTALPCSRPGKIFRAAVPDRPRFRGRRPGACGTSGLRGSSPMTDLEVYVNTGVPRVSPGAARDYRDLSPPRDLGPRRRDPGLGGAGVRRRIPSDYLVESRLPLCLECSSQRRASVMVGSHIPSTATGEVRPADGMMKVDEAESSRLS
jgi:hypothetical protein